mgnify:CR=1 FL=1
MSHPLDGRATIAQSSFRTVIHQLVDCVGHPIPIDHALERTTHHTPLQTPLLFPVQIPLYPYTVEAPIEPAWILYQFEGTGEPAAWIFPLTWSVVAGELVPIPTFPDTRALPATSSACDGDAVPIPTLPGV